MVALTVRSGLSSCIAGVVCAGLATCSVTWRALAWSWAWRGYVLSVLGIAMLTGAILGSTAAIILAVALWLAPAITCSLWARYGGASYERWIAGPTRRWAWRRWVKNSWASFTDRAGLTSYETRQHRRGTASVTHRPGLQQVATDGGLLTLVVRTAMGQSIEALEDAAPALRDTAGASSVRTSLHGPGLVRFDLMMGDHLRQLIRPTIPATRHTQHLPMGKREDGHTWWLALTGRHTLIAGCSGAGKGSTFWGIACGLAPASQSGLVQLLAIDLKYGMEVKIGAGLFSAVATTDREAVGLLETIEALLDQRGRELAGTVRQHQPNTHSPLVVLMIDELAALTAYLDDRDLKRRADHALRVILTKGRALGVLVVGALQDPRKETLPMRGLFTQTIALRLRSREEVTMVLGEGMAHLAPAHTISDSTPGVGYVVADDGATIKTRATYWTDDQIRLVAGTYPAASTFSFSAIDDSQPSQPRSEQRPSRHTDSSERRAQATATTERRNTGPSPRIRPDGGQPHSESAAS